MARELSAILSELNNVYNPQRETVNQQMQSLDPMMQAEEKGLASAKEDAFAGITNQANRRGLFYSGIPVAEEQKYTGSTYLPALANLKGKYAQQRFNLQDALSKIQQEQYSQAYGIRQGELDNETRLAAARASAGGGAGMASPSFGLGGNQAPSGQAGGYGIQQRSDKGFNFVDQYGKPISAALYAQGAGIPFRDLLQQMAAAGDSGAKRALGFVGNDYGYNPNAIGGNTSLYNNLVWGTGRQYTGGGGSSGGGGW